MRCRKSAPTALLHPFERADALATAPPSPRGPPTPRRQVLVDGPKNVTGVQRGTLPIAWLALTRFTVAIPRSVKSVTLAKHFKAADIQAKWAKTSWAQKLERQQKRAATTDFDRFKVMVARKQVRPRGRLRRARAAPPTHSACSPDSAPPLCATSAPASPRPSEAPGRTRHRAWISGNNKLDFLL